LTELNPDINWRKGTLRWREEEALPSGIRYISKQELINCCLRAEPIYVLHVRSLLERINAAYNLAVRNVSANGASGDPIPREYYRYKEAFSEENADMLPLNSEHDHAINLMPDKSPPHLLIYNLSAKELKILREYIEKAMAKG